jgi:hypothetical protein
LPNLPAGLDTFAFAFWGGEFYLFYRVSGMGNSTNVYRYNLQSGIVEVLKDTGKNIIGAGVSTCAPVIVVK